MDLNNLNKLVEIRRLSELESLMYLRISHCNSLERLPNLSKLDKLQHLEREACPNIRDIKGIKGLESWEWDDQGCTILKRLLDASRSTWLCQRTPVYDVLLSFRGADTRHSIIDSIYGGLVRNGISVYKDGDQWRLTNGIVEEMQPVLHLTSMTLTSTYPSSIRAMLPVSGVSVSFRKW